MVKCTPPIEFRHFRYFIAAAEHGSFRKASAALGVHQSSLSRGISDMEDALGASLFQRGSGGVSLTIAGQRFLVRARRVARDVEKGVLDVASIGRSEDGRVAIGILSSIASGFLAKLLSSYHHHHPNVEVELRDGNPSEHVASIRRLALDVAFVTGSREWSGCDTEHLWSERVFAALPEQHPLASLDELNWRDMADETFIVLDVAPNQEVHDFLIQRLAERGHHPKICTQYVGRENLMPLIALGRGLAVISEAMTAPPFPGVCYRPIDGESLPFSAVWSPRNDNPALRRILSLARSIAKMP